MPDGPPTRPGISLGDTGTGMLMAITIASALYKRQMTGQGRRLQVAMQDAIMHYMRINFATQGLTGKPAQRGGSKVPGVNNAPMGLYPCAPGGPNDYVYIMTSRANPEHWDRLLKLVGREDLLGDPRYATPADRVAREAEVDAIIAAWTRQHTKHEAMNAVGSAGIPAGAVLDTMELQNDPTLRATRHHADHPPPDAWRLQDARLAGAHRRQAADAADVAGAGAAHGRSVAVVAGHERGGGRSTAGGRDRVIPGARTVVQLSPGHGGEGPPSTTLLLVIKIHHEATKPAAKPRPSLPCG